MNGEPLFTDAAPAMTDPGRPQAAYVHVPFCVHRCGYCDFTVIAGRDELMPAYLECLELELRSRLPGPCEVQTLFLGGGTPSLLPAPLLDRLLGLLQFWLPLAAEGEFSIECNPDRFGGEQMDVLRARGVTRVSLGVQSFLPRHLQTLERQHDAEQVQRVVEQLRRRGLDNLSLDLIFGVPGQSLDEWRRDLHMAFSLAPRHLSTYGLTFEKGTAFWGRREKRTLQPAAEELEREMYDLAMTYLPTEGYQQYELSNFAQSGWECRHNQVYWRGEPYYGFGPGAAGYLEGVRSVNHRSVTAWMQRLRAGRSPVQSAETLTPDLAAREAVMLGLRQTAGIDLADFEHRHSWRVRELGPAAYDRFLAQGLLEETSQGRVRLTRSGRFLADAVAAEFL